MSYWETEEAIFAWKRQAEHTVVRDTGRARWYDRYELRVARVEVGKVELADRMAEILRTYNVIAIFHGHFHGSGWYEWKGFDVYDIGSAKHGWKDFAVVRVTDTSLTVSAALSMAG